MPSTKRKLSVALKRQKAMTVSRISIGKKKLVYVMLADRKLHYLNGKSRIAYIGTTKKGVSRISSSVAQRANGILSIRGVFEFEVRVISCPPRQRVRTWVKLERALLMTFREMFGEIPEANSHGKKMKAKDEFSLFAKSRLRAILEDLS